MPMMSYTPMFERPLLLMSSALMMVAAQVSEKLVSVPAQH
jgi:hypothetical protein